MASAPPPVDMEPFDPMNPSGDQSMHISDVFGFDPDDGGDEPPATPPPSSDTPVSDDGTSVGAEGEGGAETKVKTPPEPTVEEAAATEAKLTKAADEARIKALEDKLEALAKPAEPAKTDTPAVDAPPPPVSITMPDQLREMLLSEDPDQMVSGITQIINSLATQTRDIGMGLAKRLEALEASTTASRAAATTATTTADTNAASTQMRTEYYTDFPAHKAPEFQPIIAAVAAELALQLPDAAWDADYRKALGARVADRARKLATLMNGGNGAPPPALPGRTRSASTPAGSKDKSDEILDILNTWDS